MAKRESQSLEFYATKVQQLSAMGGFPISREAAQQAVKRAEARPIPNLSVLKKKVEAKLASGPAYRILH
jgi:hypothetical protein